MSAKPNSLDFGDYNHWMPKDEDAEFAKALRSMRVSPTLTLPPPCSVEALMYERLFGSKQANKEGERTSIESVSSNGTSPSVSPVRSLSSQTSSNDSSSRDYNHLMRYNKPLFTFGSEGTGDGQFNRPWGVCCDKKGRILVVDRSNNRIQIFNPNGEFILMFGTKGALLGQLNRPAGITVNSHNHIVVADKDNHRIQLFDEQGAFIFTFGGHGRQIGLFNYPWDIFSKEGQFLRKCTFDLGILGRNIYAPRGVCYMPNDSLIVTDFNGHRIAIADLEKHIIKVSFFGTEGNSPGCFFRPQGVCLDNDNNILVADSRCDRIQVFSAGNMRLLAVLDGCKGLDRPVDVCVGLDGRIYVVDFGNNCVRVF